MINNFIIEQIGIDEYQNCNNIWNMKKCPFTQDFIKQIIAGSRTVYIYKINGKFIGEVDLVTKSDDSDYTIDGIRCYLSRLIVKKEYRNNGIGSKLTEFLINKAKERGYSEISLGVDCGNSRAIYLYEKFGFKVFKKCRDEYGEYFKMLKKSV